MSLLGGTFKAFRRYRAGKGFGIHSPFAYAFVTNVIRLPKSYAYYAYHEIDYWHQQVSILDTGHKTLPRKYLRLIFRVINHFNTRHILQIGTCDGLVALSAASASSQGHVDMFDKKISRLTDSILQRSARKNQITLTPSLPQAVMNLDSICADGSRPIVIITDTQEPATIKQMVEQLRGRNPVYIVAILRNNPEVWELITSAHPTYGMSFANPHIGIMVTEKSLPRQHFNLWI